MYTALREKLKKSQRVENFYIGNYLRGERMYSDDTNSILAKLTMFKRTYCDNNGGNENDFFEHARVFLEYLLSEQLDGLGLYAVISDKMGWVDTDIKEFVKDMFAEKKHQKNILELFEKSYDLNKMTVGFSTEKGLTNFANKLRSPYFERTSLYPHFYERLKTLAASSA